MKVVYQVIEGSNDMFTLQQYSTTAKAYIYVWK